MTQPLRTVLSLRFAAISLLPMLFMGGVVWQVLLPRLDARVAEEHRALAISLAHETERYLEQPVRALRGVAVTLSREQDRRPGGALPNQLLTALVLAGEALESAYALDAQGRLIEIALPQGAIKRAANYIGLDLSGNPLSGEAHRSGRKVYSESYLSAVTEQIAVAATVPAGERLLVAEIGLRRLSEFVRRVAISSDMRLMVVDGRGQVVAHPDAELSSQQTNIGNLDILVRSRERAGTKESVTEKFTFEGRKVMGTAHGIAGTEWTVLVTEPLDRVHQPVWEILYGLALAGAFSALLAIGIGVLMATGFSTRFRRLSSLAGELAAGRMPQNWPESSITEPGELIGSMRQMADAVRQREGELRELNAELEARVHGRTADLERTNAELSVAMQTLEQAQDELVRSEKMAALGSLVAGVAHELNTPIGNSLMVASTLGDRTHEFESSLEHGLTRSALNRQLSTCREASLSLVRNLQRAAELISSFKQVAVDQTTSARRRFSLDELVREIIVTLSPTMRKASWRIETAVPPGIDFDSYPGPLGQVLTNLITNAAVHAFDESSAGVVSIEASRLDERSVQLIVSDNGEGILPEHLARIFDPFFTTRMGRGGTGLGLSICHNIVENALGGRIHVASTPGQGTVFSLALPLVAPLVQGDGEGLSA